MTGGTPEAPENGGQMGPASPLTPRRILRRLAVPKVSPLADAAVLLESQLAEELEEVPIALQGIPATNADAVAYPRNNVRKLHFSKLAPNSSPDVRARQALTPSKRQNLSPPAGGQRGKGGKLGRGRKKEHFAAVEKLAGSLAERALLNVGSSNNGLCGNAHRKGTDSRTRSGQEGGETTRDGESPKVPNGQRRISSYFTPSPKKQMCQNGDSRASSEKEKVLNKRGKVQLEQKSEVAAVEVVQVAAREDGQLATRDGLREIREAGVGETGLGTECNDVLIDGIELGTSSEASGVEPGGVAKIDGSGQEELALEGEGSASEFEMATARGSPGGGEGLGVARDPPKCSDVQKGDRLETGLRFELQPCGQGLGGTNVLPGEKEEPLNSEGFPGSTRSGGEPHAAVPGLSTGELGQAEMQESALEDSPLMTPPVATQLGVPSDGRLATGPLGQRLLNGLVGFGVEGPNPHSVSLGQPSSPAVAPEACTVGSRTEPATDCPSSRNTLLCDRSIRLSDETLALTEKLSPEVTPELTPGLTRTASPEMTPDLIDEICAALLADIEDLPTTVPFFARSPETSILSAPQNPLKTPQFPKPPDVGNTLETPETPKHSNSQQPVNSPDYPSGAQTTVEPLDHFNETVSRRTPNLVDTPDESHNAIRVAPRNAPDAAESLKTLETPKAETPTGAERPSADKPLVVDLNPVPSRTVEAMVIDGQNTSPTPSTSEGPTSSEVPRLPGVPSGFEVAGVPTTEVKSTSEAPINTETPCAPGLQIVSEIRSTSEAEVEFQRRQRVGERRRRGRMAVTDLCALEWCEMQVDFSTKVGKPAPTPVMLAGTARHEQLEREVITRVEVPVAIREDAWALKLLNMITGLRQLMHEGMTRELYIIGRLEGHWIAGIIDELRLEERGGGLGVLLCDTKTRRTLRPPSDAQKRTGMLQLMCYKLMFDALVSARAFSPRSFFHHFGLNARAPLSADVIDHAAGECALQVAALEDVLTALTSECRGVPAAHRTLLLRYEWQERRTVWAEDEFEFDAEWVKGRTAWHLESWFGLRGPEVVPEAERWKCRFCAFRDACDVGKAVQEDAMVMLR